MSKQLLFFFINKPELVEAYRLCLETASTDICNEKIHVLCIIEESLRESIEAEVSNIHGMYCLHKETYIITGSNAFAILEWPFLSEYHKVIYIECTMMFLPYSVKTLFAANRIDGVLHLLPEQSESQLDFELYTPEEKTKIKASKWKHDVIPCIIGWMQVPKSQKSKTILEQLQQIKNDISTGVIINPRPYINRRILLDQKIDYVYSQLVVLQPEELLGNFIKANKGAKDFRFQPLSLYFNNIDKNECLKRMNKVVEVIREIKIKQQEEQTKVV